MVGWARHPLIGNAFLPVPDMDDSRHPDPVLSAQTALFDRTALTEFHI
jgi:hypothetical protein